MIGTSAVGFGTGDTSAVVGGAHDVNAMAVAPVARMRSFVANMVK
jgi:hypothetical protein